MTLLRRAEADSGWPTSDPPDDWCTERGGKEQTAVQESTYADSGDLSLWGPWANIVSEQHN